jgi:flagellar biosynthesis chaperone FliJ
MVPVRLDVVVKVKQREEDRRLERFSKDLRQVEAARDALQQAQRAANTDNRVTGLAAVWSLEEAARQRAVAQVANAKARLDEAAKAAEASRSEWAKARNSAEAVRRVADARRDEVVRELNRRETRDLDELALLRRHG